MFFEIFSSKIFLAKHYHVYGNKADYLLYPNLYLHSSLYGFKQVGSNLDTIPENYLWKEKFFHNGHFYAGPHSNLVFMV